MSWQLHNNIQSLYGDNDVKAIIIYSSSMETMMSWQLHNGNYNIQPLYGDNDIKAITILLYGDNDVMAIT